MKKLNPWPMIMALAMIISLTLTSCVKEVKNSIDNEKLENENIFAEHQKVEMTQVCDSGLVVYGQKQTIKLDPKFSIAGKEEQIKEAYNKPGKPIIFNERYHYNYSAKSLWTRYSRYREIVMLHYNKQKQQFIFQENKPKIEVGLDILPMLIFLALLGISIYGLYTKNDLEIFLVFCLCLSVFILSLNYVIRWDDSDTIVMILISLIATVLIFGLYELMMGVFKLIGLKNLPMEKRHTGKSHMVLAYCFVASAFFIALFNLPSKYLYIPNLILLSPYLVFWTSLIVKSIKSKNQKKLEHDSNSNV